MGAPMAYLLFLLLLLLYAIPRKSQALHRKFTSASAGPDNDHEAVFLARDGLMADFDTQLGDVIVPHRFSIDRDLRRIVSFVVDFFELLCLRTGAHPGGVEGVKAREIALLVGHQAVSQEAAQRQIGAYGERRVQVDAPSPSFRNQSGVNLGWMVLVSSGTP